MTEQTTTDGEEVEWLKEQFNPAQHVPKGTWVKMQIARGNRERGDEVRAEHERMAEAQRERVAAQRARIDEMKSHAAHDMAGALEREREKNRQAAALMREQQQARMAEAKQAQEQQLRVLRARAAEARKLDGILDAREEAQDAKERAEGTAARVACAEARKEMIKRDKAKKAEAARLAKEQAEEARQAREQEARERRRQADETRDVRGSAGGAPPVCAPSHSTHPCGRRRWRRRGAT